MDAEHRHELKSNELANWISQIPGWIKQNSNIVIGVLLILVGLITWPMLSKMSKQKDYSQQAEVASSIQMMESDIIQSVSQKDQDPQERQKALSKLLLDADTLLEKADKVDNANTAALARIKAAQTLRTELQLRREEVSAQTVEQQIKKAQDAYKKAYDQAKMPAIKGLAQLGLGLCAEELGQAEEAKSIYNEIIKNEDYAATVVPAQAKDRLDVLATGTGEVYFAPAPPAPAQAPSVEMPAPGAPVIEAAPQAPSVTIEPAPAQRKEQAEKEEAVTPAVPQTPEKQDAETMIREKQQEGTMAPADVPAEQTPAEQKAAPNE